MWEAGPASPATGAGLTAAIQVTKQTSLPSHGQEAILKPVHMTSAMPFQQEAIRRSPTMLEGFSTGALLRHAISTNAATLT